MWRELLELRSAHRGARIQGQVLLRSDPQMLGTMNVAERLGQALRMIADIHGLISICAAGGIGVTAILER